MPRQSPAAKTSARTAGGLDEYVRRRDFARTPEPAPRPPKARKDQRSGCFVVQKHDARRLHFDLRLEIDGVLKSWAVTRGPSLDPADKRLAVQTEDHPMDYATFEGTIPAGEYGGGTMMLWDRGTWTYEGDGSPAEAVKRGKLPLRLDGERLKGGWTLVRMGGKAAKEKRDNWLLIKADDDTARPGEGDALIVAEDTSCASGRSMDAIAAGQGAENADDGAPIPDDLAPQLCSRADQPPEGEDWIHEIKFDGYRILVVVEDGAARVLTRSGLDWTDRFPSIAEACAGLPVRSAVLDGEAVVTDSAGLSSFALLQEAIGRFGNRRGDIGQVRGALFDLLFLNGTDLRPRPLIERKETLRGLLEDQPQEGVLFYSDHIDEAGGPAVLRNACGMALEGIISKRRDRPYIAGRGKDWVKSKCVERQEFVIGGFTPPSHGGPGIGAVVLGVYEDGRLIYCGKVGTGFTEASGKAVRAALEKRRRERSPFAGFGRKEAGRDAVFVEPDLICEIEFLSWSRDGMVRQGSFQGLREDKDPREIGREAPGAKAVKGPKRGKGRAAVTSQDDDVVAGVRLSNPDKVLYADMGLTKRGLAEFVAEVGERLLREVTDRPVSLVRCPDGPGKSCFYQRHAFKGLPEDVEDVDLGGTKGKTLVVRSLRGLVGLVQLGVLELHPWGARADKPDRPDRLILDLDPDEGLDFARVKAAALEVRERLDDAGLRSFLKVTGGKGLHVVVPLARRHDWATVKEFGRALAGDMEADAPGSYVATMSKAKRKGRIFIDFFRNDRGSTAIAAWSPRARAGAPVAVPLPWEDLPSLSRADLFTVESLRRRLGGGADDDPWAEMDSMTQSLTAKARRAVGMKT